MSLCSSQLFLYIFILYIYIIYLYYIYIFINIYIYIYICNVYDQKCLDENMCVKGGCCLNRVMICWSGMKEARSIEVSWSLLSRDGSGLYFKSSWTRSKWLSKTARWSAVLRLPS